MTEPINFQLPEGGFGNYLKGILPYDQSVLAGAFASSMMQIKNIQYVNLPNFAQCVYSIETNNGLPLINGTNVPADTFLVGQALSKIALGSDIGGTYNMSNFIGSVSGLPYPLTQINQGISALESENLYNIYDDLYLAVKWLPATATVNYETRTTAGSGPGLYNWEYRINSVTLTNGGGGYGREGAAVPTSTFGGTSYSGDGGATAGFVVNTDPTAVPGPFGTVTNVISTAGTWVTYATDQPSSTPVDPGLIISVEAPPNTDAGVPGMNSPSSTNMWSPAPGPMNTIIDNYVILADAEISRIQNQSPEAFEAANALNILWNITGLSLKLEQRSRYAALAPVAIPYFKWITPFPMALINFIDTMPVIAEDTCPNGPAQNLENNINLCEPGGQSIVGLMRELRNQQRLISTGLEQDNTISNEIPEELNSQQCVNGTVVGAVEGIPSAVGEFTLPSWSEVKTCEGDPISPSPYTTYDPNFQGLRRYISPGLPQLGTGFGGDLNPPYVPGNVNTITNLTPDSLPPTGDYPVSGTNDIQILVLNPNVPVGDSIPLGPAGIPIDDLPIFPTANTLPFTLNSNYTSATLIPSQYNVNAAIEKVIECNCDCWVQ